MLIDYKSSGYQFLYINTSMTQFQNRLIRNSSPKTHNTKEPLKGEELVSYVLEHRKEFKDDGDALCIAVGYGREGDGGEILCNLPAFIKELDEATDLDSYVDEESGH